MVGGGGGGGGGGVVVVMISFHGVVLGVGITVLLLAAPLVSSERPATSKATEATRVMAAMIAATPTTHGHRGGGGSSPSTSWVSYSS
ncbi:Uncharacterised protein [Mycobacteroides abscessus subsp. abscessus]|nr:Uncharacterised protein [Mycobacteroides abscessus subsp. abscessus]SHW50727.1 Uncharacterised protein [Mycobacteroides abscessus subsp. abscessus]SIL34771.1 Uncharacterised protein [Mycobacteroides abscessus subsp. abscessus]